ncbi:MAG: sigma-54-dependent transcriptional regulator, partial [Gemmatimonadaceae bacterium]
MRQSVHDVALIGSSSPMRELRALIARVAPLRMPVLIEGATGTGKELAAALLHRESGRTGSLVAFNVCALGDTMFDDALFGHVKGAYTGAVGESLGFLREANGGTAFFDEISGLPLPLQAKLLRAIESGVFRPIGAARDAVSEFRTVAATNEYLRELVDVGRFREDLMHRLSGITIRMPTLAERVDDIPELVRHFVRHAAPREMPVCARAIVVLQETPWPGNVRELRQVIDASVAFARGELDTQAVYAALAHRSVRVARPRDVIGLAERRELVTVLERASGDTGRAAELLGVHRATVYR